MPIRTRSFGDTVKARAALDAEFKKALLNEAVIAHFAGDFDTAKAILRLRPKQ